MLYIGTPDGEVQSYHLKLGRDQTFISLVDAVTIMMDKQHAVMYVDIKASFDVTLTAICVDASGWS